MNKNIKIFTKIYETKKWGEINGKGTSGNGSSIEVTGTEYNPFIKNFIKENNIKTVVDLGCGDWQSSNEIYRNLDINYYGYDAYKKIIDINQKKYSRFNFIHQDIQKLDKIKNGDLCILKDILQHWKTNDIYNFMDKMINSKKYKFILICNCEKQEYDDQDIKRTGKFRGLSHKYLPLKKYNPKLLLRFNGKELLLIKCVN